MSEEIRKDIRKLQVDIEFHQSKLRNLKIRADGLAALAQEQSDQAKASGARRERLRRAGARKG